MERNIRKKPPVLIVVLNGDKMKKLTNRADIKKYVLGVIRTGNKIMSGRESKKNPIRLIRRLWKYLILVLEKERLVLDKDNDLWYLSTT